MRKTQHKQRRHRFLGLVCPVLALVVGIACEAGEWTGTIKTGAVVFPESPAYDAQHPLYLSLRLNAEYYHTWPESDSGFIFEPFLRLDAVDTEHTHLELRQLLWFKRGETWDLRLGIGQEEWGCMQSKSIGNFLNQKDYLEGLSARGKLGQPMGHLALHRDYGTWNFYVLPGLRKAQFPSQDLPIHIEENNPLYASSNEEWNIDFALRFERSSGAWDLGLTQFYGTARQPSFIPYWRRFPVGDLITTRGLTRERLLNKADKLAVEVVPYYDRASITAIDIQYAHGPALYKFEALAQLGEREDRYAASVGIEYTFPGVFGSDKDLMALGEFHYEDRTEPWNFDLLASTLTLGGRLLFNDSKNTSAQFGTMIDIDSGGTALALGMSRQIAEAWTMNIAATLFPVTPVGDPLHYLRQDDALRVEFTWFF